MATALNIDITSILTLLVSVFTGLALLPDISLGHGEDKHYSLLLISFDGFRWNYLNRTHTPNFDRFLSKGVYARSGVKNVFVTNTLPNHWSMVTGLYPESHGILDNYIVDPHIEKRFIPKYKDATYQNDPRYYDAGGEPIWVTNEKQNDHARSGSIMWWGSENAVKEFRPSLQVPYDDSIKFEDRIDKIVEWFTQDHPINLGLVYFPEPDHTAHKTGPDSANVTQQIARADNITGYLLRKLEAADLLDDLNIIITSDHGFTTVSKERLIFLDDIVQPEDYQIITYTPLASIFPLRDKKDEVYHRLKEASEKKDSHFQVFRAKDIPSEYHYKNNDRVPPIVAIADWQWSFIVNMSVDNFTLAGTHGYDNNKKDMHPFFVAMGPSFKQGYSVDTFSITDIYPLMCHLLNLEPAPNNGSMDIVSELLQKAHKNTIWTFGTYILVLIVIASVGGVFSIAACRQHRYLKRKTLQLKLSPMQSAVKYSTPTKHGAKVSLLSRDDDDDDDDDLEEFDDADDGGRILEIVSKR